MSEHTMISVDGNEACAMVAHKLCEVAAIYPITPSSNMGEWADEWSVRGRKNLWGQVPDVIEMQSEAGAIGAVHGALQAGALATTFTASQGLLLMIPNMYKIAGELTSFAMHVSARCVATHALSIFGDHSDVMTCRMTGFAMLSSTCVQEAHDLAAIAHAATLKARVPFLHFFDGFRTSHEVNKIAPLSDEQLKQLITDEMVAAPRARALTPDRPVIRGTAQNPDTFFQAREACNRWYDAVPGIVEETMREFARITGRAYQIVAYTGAADAERVIVIMGSGAETASETARYLVGRGEKVGVVTVRLYRPFPGQQLLAALPASVRRIAVLDRTKEPGASGEPLLLDVIATLADSGRSIQVIGGRYGLSSKEFTPAMVKAVFDELAKPEPKRRFTVGIIDDVTQLSLPIGPELDVEPEGTVRAVFYGLGADGTVGANKNTIKIIGHLPGMYAQGYFVYDSKKSGSMTVSHLRFGRHPIKAPYLIGANSASFVAVHQWRFIERLDVLECAAPGATVLINAPFPKDEVWSRLPVEFQQTVVEKRLKLYAIDAVSVAKATGMGGRINTIMQTCFFALSQVLPREQAIAEIKAAIKKTYGRRGDDVVHKNWAAVDAALANLHEIAVGKADSPLHLLPIVPDDAPAFTKAVQAVMLAGKGDKLPVSAFPVDGTWPTATSQWEKRGIAVDIPVWDPAICIQCNKCAFVCPHAAIRPKAYDPAALASAPPTFKSMEAKAPELKGKKFTIQVAPEDCTGCGLCVVVCPAKDRSNPKHKALEMAPALPLFPSERENYRFFLALPDLARTTYPKFDVRTSQYLQPLFEYSGACAGCGETPYIKLMSQLFGDRVIIANATGCSSIYGGNLPTTPYAVNPDGRGPAWSNSLFEDNAEFGFGLRLGVDALSEQARLLLYQLAPKVGGELAAQILSSAQVTEQEFAAQRGRVNELKRRLAQIDSEEARRLLGLADYLVDKSIWIVGGDGWAYDIGYGGLDHVLANRRRVRLLVLDTEVYSNTGGQASKATPIGAAAKFAVAGKAVHKKDLGLMAMAYGHVYVASVAFGAKDAHTVQVFQEAESYPGPALIIAYSHCIAHGYDLRLGLEQQRLAVDSGVWPLYRFDPRRSEKGELPLVLDSAGGKVPVMDYLRNETRFRMVEKLDPERFKALSEMQSEHAAQRVALYQKLAELRFPLDRQAPAVKAQAVAGGEE
ncbi:MAG: pyruvate:ferredoxin (flavodoxin) oxidoreductase [Planctomycetota bacterium]|nr:pyruvate:ferredoxin (flavodoxin) oxidoreductase [Planctomycetota bacterium]